jgi:hypothetical protein
MRTLAACSQVQGKKSYGYECKDENLMYAGTFAAAGVYSVTMASLHCCAVQRRAKREAYEKWARDHEYAKKD